MPSVVNKGVRIRYEVEGDGPPLVLHHGFSYCLESWRDSGYATVLKETHALILIDARGHGASDKPHDFEAYALKEFAGDVLAVLDELGVARAHYFGYSLGGRVGYVLGSIAPERIVSLMVCGASCHRTNPNSIYEWVEAIESGMPAFLEWWRRIDAPPTSFHERVLTNDSGALGALLRGLAQEPGLASGLRRLTMPCLLMSGERDAECLRIRATADAIPGAAFVPLSELTHGQSFFKSELVLPHLRKFLANFAPQPCLCPPHV